MWTPEADTTSEGRKECRDGCMERSQTQTQSAAESDITEGLQCAGTGRACCFVLRAWLPACTDKSGVQLAFVVGLLDQ